MNYLIDAALFLGLVLGLVVAGWCISNPWRSSFEAAFVPGAAFLGSYAALIWIVGSVWQLIPAFWCVLPWPLLAILIVWKRQNLLHHARTASKSLRALSAPDSLLAFYLLALFGLAFGFCLAPPSGADYDSLTYHLAVPAQYLRFGKVVELPYDHHSYFPFTLEMLFTLGLWARGVVFAKLFHWLMLPIGALALVALGKRAGSARAGLLAACLYASSPLILQEATTAYIDLGFAAFTFLAILSFVIALETRSRREFALCGAFCGFCLGTKYFGALIFGFLGLWLLFSVRKTAQNPFDRMVWRRNLAFFTLSALILGGFWYARNIVWTGNPVFPFAYRLFGGQGWTAQMARDYDISQAIYGFGKTPIDLVWLPWRLAMSPLNFGQPLWPLATPPLQNGLTGAFEVQGLLLSSFPGPALFAFGVPALFLANKPRPIVLVTAFFSFLLAFWFLTSQQIRYLIPALGMLALIGGWGIVQIAPRLRFASKIGAAMLALWLLFAPYWLVQNNRVAWDVISGAQTPTAYLRRTFSGFDAMEYANQNTPKNAKFAVFGESRCFYLDRNYFWGDDLHNNLIPFEKIQNGADFARALRSLGTTHVLANTDAGRNGGGIAPPQSLIDQALEAGKLNLVTELRGYRIYSVAQ